MTNTNSYEDLGRRIEQLVADHIAASRRTAQEAVERAFASAGAAPVVTRRQTKPSGGGKKRRASADVAALGERFYQALCAKPGETMTVLAIEVGASARELHRAVARLKDAGRVRAVGHRALTRYFPVSNGAAS